MKNKRSRFLNIAVTLCAAGSVFANGMVASAAEQSENLDSYQGEEYVVTATRTELTAKEVPQSVEVITKEEIQNIGATNVKEALKIATNVDVTEAAGMGNHIGIRGSGINDVLVLINGKRRAGEGLVGTSGTNTYILERLNVNNIERIEILRGPAGALYGSDAQAGVINIVTKKAEKESVTVGVTTGSREISNYYHLDTGKAGKLSATFDANFTKQRYFKWEDAGMSRYYGPRQNYTLDMDYVMDDNNKLNLFLEYDKQNMSYKMAGITRAHVADRKTAGITYEGKAGNNNFSISSSYSYLNREDQDRKYKYWNIEARDTIALSEDNKLTVGAEYRNDRTPVRNLANDYPTRDVSQYALYLHDEHRIGDKWLIIPSVRYDHHDSFGSHTSPNLGVTYFVDDTQRIKANYGSAYRAPTASELYMDGTGSSMSIIGNPNLKPEKTEGYEISYEKEWSNTSTKLTYFKNKKEDAISAYEDVNGLYHYYNIDKTATEGIEFEASQNLGNGFELTGNYEYLDAKNDVTGERLDYSAKNTYTAKLSWTEPEKQEWNVTAWNRWYSDYRYHDKDYSINTFNIVVNKRWGDKFRAFVGVDNVFDKEITEMRYSGRLWRVGAEMTF